MEKVPILKGKKVKTRILRPQEYNLIRTAAGETENRTLMDGCLLMGARYEECKRVQLNPWWFDGDFIHLPAEAQLKVKRKQVERWIRLSAMGKAILPYFFESKRKLPSVQAWDADLIRWTEKAKLSTIGISARTLRKTYESWLIFSYPDSTNLVYLSQGHTTMISLQHYVNLPFLDEDKREMKRWVDGWV